MGNQESLFSYKPKVEVPPPAFQEIDVEEQSFTWTIENYHVIRMHKPLITSQRIDLGVKDPTGHRSQWTASLMEYQQTIVNDRRWIWIYLRPESSNPTGPTVYSQFRFTIKNKEGEVIKESETGLMYVDANTGKIPDWFSPTYKSIDADDADFCPEENLVIHITVKVYTPSQPKLLSSLEVIQQKFQVTFFEQFRKDFDKVLETPEACTDMKIVANDGKELTMKRGILAVRSDVFAAMLSCDMIEANSGVIHLPDISSKALEVLLNYLATGTLLPEWSNTEVLPELTNAAAKYQLQGVLQFLDLTIGKVGQVKNVKPLIILSRQLSLKVAEEELLTFVIKEGGGSVDNFIQIWNSELPVEGDESDEPKAKRQKFL